MGCDGGSPPLPSPLPVFALLQLPLSSSIPLYVSNPSEQMGGGENKRHASLLRCYNTVNQAPPLPLTSCPLPIMLFSLLSTFQPALPQSLPPSHCLSIIIISLFAPPPLMALSVSPLIGLTICLSVLPFITTNNYWPFMHPRQKTFLAFFTF